MLSYKVCSMEYKIAYQLELYETFQKAVHKNTSGIEGDKLFFYWKNILIFSKHNF